jgi:hypothetical protein
MKLLLGSFLALSLATLGHAAPGSDLLARGFKCGNLEDTIAYDIIEALHATSFCSSWLGYTSTSTSTSLTTSISTSIAYTTVTASASSAVTTTTTTTLPTVVPSTKVITLPTSILIVESDTVTTVVSTSIAYTTVDASTYYSYSLYLDPNAKKMKRDSPVKRSPPKVKPPKPARKFVSSIRRLEINGFQNLLHWRMR